MNYQFQKRVDSLPGLLEALEASPLKSRDQLGKIPNNGIYVFFENGLPVYVGRTNKNRMRERIMVHGRPSSTHYSASFAFNMAKRSARERGMNTGRSREELQRDPDFDQLFTEAKERIAGMSVRVISIDDPITQTLFEVYASVTLGTDEYNKFDTS